MTSHFDSANEHWISGWTGRILRRGRFRVFCSKKPQLLGWEHGKIRGPKFDTLRVKLDGFGRKFFQTVVDDKIPRNLGLKLRFQVPRNFCLRDISLWNWLLEFWIFSIGSYPDTHEKKGTLPSRWPTHLPGYHWPQKVKFVHQVFRKVQRFIGWFVYKTCHRFLVEICRRTSFRVRPQRACRRFLDFPKREGVTWYTPWQGDISTARFFSRSFDIFRLEIVPCFCLFV